MGRERGAWQPRPLSLPPPSPPSPIFLYNSTTTDKSSLSFSLFHSLRKRGSCIGPRQPIQLVHRPIWFQTQVGRSAREYSARTLGPWILPLSTRNPLLVTSISHRLVWNLLQASRSVLWCSARTIEFVDTTLSNQSVHFSVFSSFFLFHSS